MGALPRPDLPPGPQRDLVEQLHELHHQAGWPSLRRLAVNAGCSHTTVSHVFSSPRLPAWGILELVVESLEGDVAAFRRLWLAAGSPTGDAATSHPPGTIAGRATELAAVRRHVEEGAGLLIVTGEAGMGKTRLVEVATGAAGSSHVLRGACLPLSREVPLLPIADVLRTAYELESATWFGKALEACPEYVAGSVARLVPEVASSASRPDPDDEWSRQRLYTAIGSLLAALASIQHVVVVIEDLHWADDATLDLLENLVTRRQTLPAIGTWRTDDPEVPEQREDWLRRVQRGSSVSLLALRPLDRAGTAEQLRLINGAVPETVVDRVHARSRGLPLFTEQLASDARGTLPRLLEDALARPLDHLDERSWRVARILGVAGRGLGDDLVASAAHLQHDELVAALHHLRDRRLLRAGDASGTVELRHPLIAEAVTRRLVPGEARQAHHQLACALAGTPDPSSAEVAAHWQAAGEPQEELTWRIVAARDAGRRFAKAQEAFHWLRVLELWPDGLELAGDPPLSRLRASFCAMYALESSSQTARAAEIVESMMGETHVSTVERAELCMLAADYQGVLGDPGRALELAEQGVALLDGLPPSDDLVKALRTRAWLSQDLGRWDAAKADVERALALNEELGDAQQHRRLLASQGWFDFSTGEREKGLARIAAAAAMTEPSDPLGDAYVAMVQSDVLMEAGAPAIDIAVATERALRVADELRIDSQLVATSRSNTAEAWLNAGEVDLAERAIGTSSDGEFRHEHWALFLTRAEIDIARGRLDHASERIEQVVQHRLGAHAQLDYLAEVHTKLLLWQGSPEPAWVCAREALERWAGSGEHSPSEQLTTLGARAVADAPADARPALLAELHALVSRLDRPADEAGNGLRAGLAALYDAEMARAAGRGTPSQWTSAAARFDRLSRPHVAAYCRWRGGQLALAEGQGAAGWRLLARALRDARQHVPLTTAIHGARAPAAQ